VGGVCFPFFVGVEERGLEEPSLDKSSEGFVSLGEVDRPKFSLRQDVIRLGEVDV
jgi:hypothetical protein